MLGITPGTNFPVVRKLGDPADTNTNYVLAVVRNSASGDTLKSIRLTDQGGQRFTGFYAVGSAEDFYIDITTTVYTDSNYTVKSDVYTEENDTYQVKTSWGLQFQNSGAIGGGTDINYKKIESLIKDGLKTLKFLTVADIDPLISSIKSELLNSFNTKHADLGFTLESIFDKLKDIEMPETTDITPLSKAIAEIRTLINSFKDKKIPTDEILQILTDHLSAVRTNITTAQNHIAGTIDELKKGIDKQIEENVLLKDKKLQEIKKSVDSIIETPITPEIKKPKRDISHLLTPKL